MERNDCLSSTCGARNSCRPGKGAFDDFFLRRMQEDGPFLPWKRECPFQFLNIIDDTEAAERVWTDTEVEASFRLDRQRRLDKRRRFREEFRRSKFEQGLRSLWWQVICDLKESVFGSVANGIDPICWHTYIKQPIS